MTLTEQWKKGELEQGEYWCKITESPYVERVYLPCCDDIIVEVLEPVSSFEDAQKLRKENQQLKELLKECKEKLKYCVRETYELQTKIDNAIGEKK